MAISVNDVYIASAKVLSNKLQAGTFKPVNFNVYAEMAQRDIFNEFYIQFQETQRITDGLRPFVTRSQLMVTNGKITYPISPMYVHLISLRSLYYVNPDGTVCNQPTTDTATKQNRIMVIDNDKVWSRLDSVIAPPSYENAIATLYDTYIQVYPIEIGSCVFEYLRQPVKPVWAYTGNPPVYDPANSVDFELNWQLTNKLIIKICAYYGITIRESMLIEASNLIDKREP